MHTVWVFQDNARERRFATVLSLAVAIQEREWATLCSDTGSGLCRLAATRPGPPEYLRTDFAHLDDRRMAARYAVCRERSIPFPAAAVLGVARPGEQRAHPAVDPQDVGDGLEIEPGDTALLCARADADPAQLAADADALRRAGASVLTLADGDGEPAFRFRRRLPDGYEKTTILRKRAPTETDGYPKAAREFQALADLIL